MKKETRTQTKNLCKENDERSEKQKGNHKKNGTQVVFGEGRRSLKEERRHGRKRGKEERR